MAVPPLGPHVFVGALQLSRDTVGREYPFLAGRTALRSVADAGTSPAWPLRWEALTDASAILVRAGVAAAPLGEIVLRLDRLPPVPPAKGRAERVDAHVQALQMLAAHAFWARTWHAADPDRAALVVARLAQTERGPIPYGLRFCLPPPSDDFGRADAVALWLAVCWHLLPAQAVAPTLLWTDGPPGALYLFFGQIAPAAFRAVLAGRPDPDRIVTVDDGPATAMLRAAGSLPAALRQLMDHPQASLAHLLDRLHTLR